VNTYQTLQQKAVGLAFVLAPLLLVLGGIAYVLGIGLTPFGTDSVVDAVLFGYGVMLMIPVFLELARILGQRAPIFGIICAIAGLCWAFFEIPVALKLLQIDIINAGLNKSIWTISPSFAGWTPVLIGVILGHVAPLLFGIGFLWKGGIPRWAAGLLIVGGIFLAIGVGGGAEIVFWQTGIVYPLATLAFLAALAPMGLRYLGGGSQVYELEMTTT
jgi:hypothetical protein